jgi:rhodanese-related sulfurtransferase
MAITEMDFEEAIKFTKERNTRLVWIGREPIEYIRELTGLEETQLIKAEPNNLAYADRAEAEKFSDHVFVCYHGNSSRYLATLLKDKFGINSISMKGGITSLVGEIF